MTPWIYRHDLDPVAFSVGPFAVHWYGLGYLAGFLIALAIMRRMQGSPGAAPGVTPDDVSDFLTWGALSVIIGGRLGQVIFYDLAYFLDHPLDVFAIWRGGMSFHGGLLGVGVATVVFSMKRGVPATSVMDLVALGGLPGIGIVRIANFINGEHFGEPLGEGAFFGAIFPGGGATPRHASQLYEAVLEGFAPFVVLLVVAIVWRGLQRPGLMLALFLLLNGLGRMVVETFRAEEVFLVERLGAWAEVLAPLTWGQLLTLPQLALGLAVLGWCVGRCVARRRRP